MDVTLNSGDLLYLPRGTIHQANCLENVHSLHITLSCHQLNTYGDLLLKLLPAALETAIAQSVEFRRGLPIDYLNYTGVVNADNDTKKRHTFLSTVQALMGQLFIFTSIDAACDQVGSSRE